MTGYEPKRGDKIRVSYEGVVTSIDTHVVTLNEDRYFYVSKAHVELVEAAPTPFEVGKPLTVEMGEPPIGSAILEVDRSSDHCVWQRHKNGWANTLGGKNIPWSDAEIYRPYLLLHLGCAE